MPAERLGRGRTGARVPRVSDDPWTLGAGRGNDDGYQRRGRDRVNLPWARDTRTSDGRKGSVFRDHLHGAAPPHSPCPRLPARRRRADSGHGKRSDSHDRSSRGRVHFRASPVGLARPGRTATPRPSWADGPLCARQGAEARSDGPFGLSLPPADGGGRGNLLQSCRLGSRNRTRIPPLPRGHREGRKRDRWRGQALRRLNRPLATSGHARLPDETRRGHTRAYDLQATLAPGRPVPRRRRLVRAGRRAAPPRKEAA